MLQTRVLHCLLFSTNLTERQVVIEMLINPSLEVCFWWMIIFLDSWHLLTIMTICVRLLDTVAPTHTNYETGGWRLMTSVTNFISVPEFSVSPIPKISQQLPSPMDIPTDLASEEKKIVERAHDWAKHSIMSTVSSHLHRPLHSFNHHTTNTTSPKPAAYLTNKIDSSHHRPALRSFVFFGDFDTLPFGLFRFRRKILSPHNTLYMLTSPYSSSNSRLSSTNNTFSQHSFLT